MYMFLLISEVYPIFCFKLVSSSQIWFPIEERPFSVPRSRGFGGSYRYTGKSSTATEKKVSFCNSVDKVIPRDVILVCRGLLHFNEVPSDDVMCLSSFERYKGVPSIYTPWDFFMCQKGPQVQIGAKFSLFQVKSLPQNVQFVFMDVSSPVLWDQTNYYRVASLEL